jgi:hypothetical protein
MLDSAFQFFLPIEKGSVQEKDGRRFVYGVTSTEDLDLDEEIVSAAGLKKSMDYFLKHGRIDYDHKSKEEPRFIIGEPVEGHFDGKNQMHLKAELYKGLDVADQVWKLLKAGSTRLGWSVGGKVIKKSMQFDKSLNKFVPKVVEAIINHIAITPHPKNVNTYATANAYGSFMKSLAVPGSKMGTIIDIGGVEYVLAERDSFEKAMSTMSGGPAGGTTPLGTSPVIPQSLESDVKVFQNYVTSKHFKGDANASRQWFKSMGIGDEKADALASYIAANHERILKIRSR